MYKRIFGGTMALVLLALAACAGFGDRFNPVQVAAQTGNPELTAFALEGSYTIVQGVALTLVQNPATPESVKAVIRSVDRRANPILDKLRPLAVEVERLRREVAAGTTPEERLTTALTQLNQLITDVSPLITELTNAVKGGA